MRYRCGSLGGPRGGVPDRFRIAVVEQQGECLGNGLGIIRDLERDLFYGLGDDVDDGIVVDLRSVLKRGSLLVGCE